MLYKTSLHKNGLTFSVETALADDASALEKVHRLCFSGFWGRKYFSEILDEPKYFCFKSLVDDATIGFIFGISIDCDAEIFTVCVLEEYRGLGIGSALLECTIEYIRKKGGKNIFLEVPTTNLVAKSMYQQLGFEHIGYRKAYYLDNEGSPVDAEVFKKVL